LEVTELKKIILTAIEDKKGFDTEEIEVGHLTSIADWFIITEGNSSRHLKAIADEIISIAKRNKYEILSVEGRDDLETGWILIDLGNIIVHIFTEEKRRRFNLEEFWKTELKKLKR